jgi:hypothetical protein
MLLSVSCFISFAERFALLALGRAWTMLGSRKSPKPEKCLKMPQNPTRQVHALLGNLAAYQNTGFYHNANLTFQVSFKKW